MRRQALELLVCPDTLEKLTLDVDEESDGDVVAGTLRAGSRAYPIASGIPSFVSAEVRADQTVRSFSDKWSQHRYYRKHTERFYTSWYLERYGFENAAGLRGFLADKQHILDAGTGAGRDAASFKAAAPGTVYGVDTAWDALAVARADPERPDVQLVHADVNRLPFPDGFFDFINCDQVIHHTPDPPVTFTNLLRKLQTGGEIATYVYRKKAVIREFVDDYVRDRIKERSFEDALAVCEGITKLGKALSELEATVEIEEDIPILGIKKGRLDVQRFIHWNVMKCFWNHEFDFFTNNVVNADWYHPQHCHRYEPEVFRRWFDGCEIMAWDEREAGISCRARKI